MNILYHIRAALFALLCVSFIGEFTSTLYAMKMPLEITEEDLKKAEAEIEAFRASLSDEERNKFDSDVAELTKALENMSEKELEEFFTQLASIDQETPAQPEPTFVPEPIKKDESKQTAPIPVTKNTQPAEQLLDALVHRLDSFLLKTRSIPEFDRKLTVWQQEEKISKTEQPISWHMLEYEIEVFKQKLIRLKDKDAKTKDFKYLYDFIDDKALYETLNDFNSSLLSYEPNIMITNPAGTPQVSSASKAAIRKVINTVINALQVQKLGERIDKIIEKYEPAAKKLKEQEEKKEQQALEASKRSRTPESAKTVGKAPSTPKFQDQQAYSGGGSSPSGYIPSGSGSSSGYSSTSAPRISETPSTGTPSSRSTGERDKISDSGHRDKANSEFKEEKEKPSSGEQKEGKIGIKANEEVKKDESIKKPDETKKLDKMVSDIKNSLQEISVELIDTSKETEPKTVESEPKSDKKPEQTKKNIHAKIKNLEQHLKNDLPDISVISRLRRFAKSVHALKEKLEKFEKALDEVSTEGKKTYTDELKELFGQYKDLLEIFAQQMNSIKDKGYTWLNALPNDIRYAYFNDKLATPSQQIKNDVSEPIDIFKIFDEVNVILETVKKLTKK